MSNTKHIQIGLLSANKEARDFVAGSFGKKGQSSDITLHTLSSQNILQTTILPEKYPDRPMSLITTAHMSDVLIVSCDINGVDASVGEAAILADCLDIPGIKAIIGSDATGMNLFLDQMDKTFDKLSVASWPGLVMSNNKELAEGRQKIVELVPEHRGDADGHLAINTDHAFPVTGIGSVILGTVISGTVKKGQKITVWPSGQTGTVRSIQVNDEDVREAGPGVHVGLAMKGIQERYLTRGSVIAASDENAVKETEKLENIPVKKAAFGKPPKIGDTIHVMAGIYTSPAKVVKWDDTVSVSLEKSIPYHSKMRISFLDLNKKPIILASRAL